MKTIYLTNANIYTGITILKNSTLIIKDGKIDNVLSPKRFDKDKIPADAIVYNLEGKTISPGFIDTHIHGIGGVGTEDASAEAVLEMSLKLAEFGVTGFCPTLYPQEPEQFIKTIKEVTKAIGKEKGAKIHGLHLEGPFISPKKLGVQRKESISEVDIDLMKRLYDAADGNIALMTVAPELENMRELAHYCIKKGIILSAGHTDGTYEDILDGMHAGILHSTHLFNAMSGLHHRDPGVVGGILIHSQMTSEIIPDGFHVNPALINLLRKNKPMSNIVMVTDALRPTQQTEGTLIANGEEVYLNDKIFMRKEDDVIAGSSLLMIKGVQNLIEWGVGTHDAIRMASTNPARVINLQKKTGSLLPGLDADIVVFDKDFKVNMTIINGNIVKEYKD
ncbi:MAG: N-acetylglucosamine-6-phosphate deacetylase [Ichthyobacteriaceae bacterium]|nr:N-acetylglucosamine-6-phosphate deacetylase [Ichthyobacteriaceae bacterium]